MVASVNSKGLPGGMAALDRWLAFAFGIIFVSALLYLATVEKNPTPLAVRVYVTVLALAAAGVGAILPGFIEIRFKNYLRAGGAIGLGVLVYLNEPAIGRNVVNWVEPKVSAEPLVDKYLAAVDSKNTDAAWSLLSELGKKHVSGSKDLFGRLYRNMLDPLGGLEQRSLIGSSVAESPEGAPPGLYRAFTYKNKFKNDPGFRGELVVVRANDKEQWEIFSHQISPLVSPN